MKDDISTAFITRVVLIVYFTALVVYRTVASVLRSLSGDMETLCRKNNCGLIEVLSRHLRGVVSRALSPNILCPGR